MGVESRAVRRSVRRAVAVDCSVQSDLWEDPIALRATDLSESGVWVESKLPLSEGEEVVVSLGLPDEPAAEPVWALASVVRVGFYRRQGDERMAGMAFALTYVSEADRSRLSRALCGRPPRIPPIEARNKAGVGARGAGEVEPITPTFCPAVLATELTR